MLESYAWEDTFGDTNFAQATYAFDLDRDSEADALPRLQDKSSEMDAAKFNAYTDLFLDWLEVFLATHSLPSRGADAIWQTEDRLSSRGCRAATLAVLTPLWFLLALFLLFLLPGEFPFREPVGLVIWGLLFLVVPVLAVAMGLKVKRDLREDHSTRSRNSRSAIRSAWVAIILGTLIIVGVVAGFGIAVMNRLTGDL
jgi:cytochrome bd-type quinol oxidase subunit 2